MSTDHWGYAKYLARHKTLVTAACFAEGLYWRGLKHDWSKFTWLEWKAYADSFYGGWSFQDRPEPVQTAFQRAWQHHVVCNDHHAEHWRIAGSPIVQMPRDAAREMLCDWWAMSAAQGHDHIWRAVKDWAAKSNRGLHPQTQLFVDCELARRITQEYVSSESRAWKAANRLAQILVPRSPK